jgi:hypothetical protein
MRGCHCSAGQIKVCQKHCCFSTTLSCSLSQQSKQSATDRSSDTSTRRDDDCRSTHSYVHTVCVCVVPVRSAEDRTSQAMPVVYVGPAHHRVRRQVFKHFHCAMHAYMCHNCVSCGLYATLCTWRAPSTARTIHWATQMLPEGAGCNPK